MLRRRLLPTTLRAAVVLVGALAPLTSPLPSWADDSCRTRCWNGYGVCYKSTSNRQHCQDLWHRCLSGCMRPKRPQGAGKHPASIKDR